MPNLDISLKRGTYCPGLSVASLILFGKIRQLNNRPDLDRAPLGGWDSACDFDRAVEVVGIDQEEAPKLLSCFRERPVCNESFAFAETNAGRTRGGVERSRGYELAALFEVMGQLSG